MKRTLAVNSRGPEVAEAQGKLNIKPPTSLPPLAVDGIFGPKTLASVKEFQKNTQLDSDGIIGPKTWAKLDAAVPIPVKDSVVCANGCAHNHVNVMQCQHSFLAAFKKEPVAQALGFQTMSTTSTASFLPSLSLPSLPSLPSVKYTRLTAAQITTALAQEGFRSPRHGEPFTHEAIRTLRRRLGLSAHRARLHPIWQGHEWGIAELAGALDVSPSTVYVWRKRGGLQSRWDAALKRWVVWADEAELDRLKAYSRQSVGAKNRQEWLDAQSFPGPRSLQSAHL